MVDRSELLTTAFALIAERGWSRFSRAELAARLGRPLVEVYELVPDRAALIALFGDHLDRAMLAFDADELEGMSPRERLFELLMRRFEAMAPLKPGLEAIGRAAPGDLELLAGAGRNLQRASGWLVEAGATGLSGWRAALGRQALIVLYLRVFSVWLDDDSPDLAATLAELDKRLQQLDQLARWSGARGDAGPARPAEPGTEPPPGAEPIGEAL